MKTLKQWVIALALISLTAPVLVEACPDYRTSAHWGCTGKGCIHCATSKPAPNPVGTKSKRGERPNKLRTPAGGTNATPIPADQLRPTESKLKWQQQ